VSRQQAAQCWECEAMIDRLANVAVRTRGQHIATLALCESCFAAHYLPLASSTDAERGELLIFLVPSSAR
jgi:RNase P subunit RPR2